MENDADRIIICERCGEENIFGNAECTRCHAQLTSVESKAKLNLRLYEKTYKKEIIISEDVMIGREGNVENDFFQQFRTRGISRKHCFISFENGDWMIEHESAREGVTTSLDGLKLEYGQKMKLRGVKKLELSGTLQFDVSFSPETEISGLENSKAEVKAEGGEMTGLFIKCPECGTYYRVKNESVVVLECEVCTDKAQKAKIRRLDPNIWPKSIPLSDVKSFRRPKEANYIECEYEEEDGEDSD